MYVMHTSPPGTPQVAYVLPRTAVITAAHVVHATKLVGHGRLSGVLSTVLSADRVLKNLRTLSEEIAEDRQQARRLGERLLATTEQDTGLPCIVSKSAFESGSSGRVGWALHKTDVLEYVTGKGTTDYVFSFSHQTPWSEDALQVARAALAEAASRVRAVKAAALRVLKLLVSRSYGFVESVPPHEASPCGVLRLAAPIVPGAPAPRSWTQRTTMALAA